MDTFRIDLHIIIMNPAHYRFLLGALKKNKSEPGYVLEMRGAYAGDRDVYVPARDGRPALWVPEGEFDAWMYAMFANHDRKPPPITRVQIALKAMPVWKRSPPSSAASTPLRSRAASSKPQPIVAKVSSRADLASSASLEMPQTPSRPAPTAATTVQPPPLTPDTPELASPSKDGSDTESEDEDDEDEGSDVEMDDESDSRSTSILEERELSMTPRGSRKWPVTLSGGLPSEQTPLDFTAYLADLFAPENKKKRRHEEEDELLDAKRRRLETRRVAA